MQQTGMREATGKVGVCFATSGPGATNLVTGIATAYMDSVPMVAITCNVTVPLLGKDSFQEIDIAGITTPITKHNFIVTDVNRVSGCDTKSIPYCTDRKTGACVSRYSKGCYGSKRPNIQAKTIQPVERLTQKMTEEDIEQAVSIHKTCENNHTYL